MDALEQMLNIGAPYVVVPQWYAEGRYFAFWERWLPRLDRPDRSDFVGTIAIIPIVFPRYFVKTAVR